MSFKEWKISSTVIEPVELVGEVFDLKAVAIFSSLDLEYFSLCVGYCVVFEVKVVSSSCVSYAVLASWSDGVG